MAEDVSLTVKSVTATAIQLGGPGAPAPSYKGAVVLKVTLGGESIDYTVSDVNVQDVPQAIKYAVDKLRTDLARLSQKASDFGPKP